MLFKIKSKLNSNENLTYAFGKIQQKDKSNKTISDMANMKKVEEVLKEQKLQWFVQIKRMDRVPVHAKNL